MSTTEIVYVLMGIWVQKKKKQHIYALSWPVRMSQRHENRVNIYRLSFRIPFSFLLTFSDSIAICVIKSRLLVVEAQLWL